MRLVERQIEIDGHTQKSENDSKGGKGEEGVKKEIRKEKKIEIQKEKRESMRSLTKA